MQVRSAARIFGIIYLLVGILGFIPGISPPAPAGAPPLALSAFYNYVLTLFAVNWLHSVVHLGIGLWGIAAAGSLLGSRSFFRTVAVIFGLLFILGIIPATNTVFGLVPLFGLDAGLHLVTALVAAYFGWGAAARDEVVVTP